LKNDGISAPKYGLWNAGDQLNSSSDNNFYYSDLGDGGYNHLELRRYKRQYTQGSNRKGDLAEPMLQTKDWLLDQVFNSNTNTSEEPLRLLWEFEYTGEPEGLSLVNLAPQLVGTDYVTISPDRKITNLDQQTGEVLWSNELPENKWVNSNMLLHDSDTFYIKINQTSKIVAWDILTGTQKWERALPSGTFFDFRHDALDTQNLYLTGNQLSFYVFSKKGEFLLEKKMDKNPRALISDGTNIYVSQAWRPKGSESSYGRIVSYNIDSMDEKWSYTTEKGGFYEASMELIDNVLYNGTVSGGGEFIALNAITGERIWKKI